MVLAGKQPEIVDSRTVQLGPNDVLVVRSDSLDRKKAMGLVDMLSESCPAWGGGVIFLTTDQNVEKLPPEAAFDAFLALERIFDPEANEARLKRAREQMEAESNSG